MYRSPRRVRAGSRSVNSGCLPSAHPGTNLGPKPYPGERSRARCHGLIASALRKLRPVAISDDDLDRLGRCVELERAYATSSAQLTQWLAEWGVPPPPVATLPISAVAPGVVVDGPAPAHADTMKSLYEAKFRS